MHITHRITACFVLMALLVGGVALFSPTAQAQSLLAPRGADTDDSSDDDEDEEEDAYDPEAADGLPIPVLFGETTIDTLDRNFGDPRGGGTRSHEGLDMMAPAGTPIVSPTDGEVRRIGSYSGAGRYVIIEADTGERFYYYHLEDQAEYLDRGDDIDVGDLIGFVGSSGNAIASAPHLHLEIREGRRAQDPYPYFSRDFSLEEKMEILDAIFSVADDGGDLAEFLVDEFPHVFQQANQAGIDIPREIEDELPDNFEDLTGVPARDLTIGASGGEVRTLHQILINAGYLDIPAPTGYFGPMTRAALADYQAANNISPAVGYYGPVTRSHMAQATDPSSATALSRSELLERIELLQEQIAELQAQISA